MDRSWDCVVAHRTKRGDLEVWRGAGTVWSHIEQREATLRPSIKKSMFPVQRVAEIMASWAAIFLFFFHIYFSLIGKYCPFLSPPVAPFLATRLVYRKQNYFYVQPEVWRGAGTVWSHIEQREATRFSIGQCCLEFHYSGKNIK